MTTVDVPLVGITPLNGATALAALAFAVWTVVILVGVRRNSELVAAAAFTATFALLFGLFAVTGMTAVDADELADRVETGYDVTVARPAYWPATEDAYPIDTEVLVDGVETDVRIDIEDGKVTLNVLGR